MTAKDLILSILGYHVKQQYAIWTKPGNNDGIKKEGEKIYSSVDAFFKYHETHNDGRATIRISEKQFSFLQSLIRNERIDRIIIGRFHFEASHPNVPTSAYGGFVGKKADTSRFILRMKRY